MSKKSLLLIPLVVILAGISLFMVLRQRVEAPVTEPTSVITEEPTTPTESYPQHIETIPGNTDEVWYNIPEWGVRMKLNKDFAEELIYSDGMTDDFGEHQSGIYFSTKSIAEVAPECAPDRGGAFGFFYKKIGIAKEDAKNNFLLERDLQNYVIQFSGFYVGYVGIQAVPWFPQHDDAVRKVWNPENYSGLGAKYVSDGMKTLEIVLSK